MRRVLRSRQADDAADDRQDVAGPVIDLLQEPVLRGLQALDFAKFRDVDLGGEDVEKAPLVVVNRAKAQLIPEGGAVLAVVEDFDLEIFFLTQRFADGVYGGGRCALALQEAAILADRLVRRIAGQLEERLIGEHDRIIGSPGIGHHHRHPGPLDRDRRKRVSIRMGDVARGGAEDRHASGVTVRCSMVRPRKMRHQRCAA